VSEQIELEKILSDYFPTSIGDYIREIVLDYKVNFRLSKPRKTKLGDFKANLKTGKCTISVNEDLSYGQFLVTTIHKLANVVNWRKNGRHVSPHGKEWKEVYKKLFQPIIPLVDEVELRNGIVEHLVNPRATSSSDVDLLKAIGPKNGVVHVEDIPLDEPFRIGKRTFLKQKKLRKRYLCIDTATKRRYYVNALAEVAQ